MAAAAVDDDLIELPNEAPSVPPALPLTPVSSAGRKRRRDSSATVTQDIPTPSPPPPPSESPSAAPAVSRGRGRKGGAKTAAETKAAEEDDAIKQELLDHPDRPLSLAQACTVYQLHIPPCAPLAPLPSNSPAPKACKPAGHPNCLHTLGYKRKGLWSSHPPHIALLGSNPATSLRPPHWYAGLKNQGATCYLNILVQSLYMNTHFRESLMRFESCRADVRRQWEQAVTSRTAHIPTADPSTALAASSDSSSSQLQDHLPYHLLSLFTRLALSHRSFIDPLAFVRSVGVKDADQQDAHEFRTYILQALEHALLNSNYKPHHTLLQTLFEGNSKSILRCQQCGHESTTASPFIDLTLPIKGRGSVYAGLQSLCEVEQLEENAVYCSTCKAKTSMDKRLEYETLPPYLNVQLMRFELVFAGNGVRKKKIGDKIYIPEKIRMEGCLLKPTAVVEGESQGVKGKEQVKDEVKVDGGVKLQGGSEQMEESGTARKRGGRRRGAVKDASREERDDDTEAEKVKARTDVTRDEEHISDETAVKDKAAQHEDQLLVKQGRARRISEDRGGKQLNGAIEIGCGEDGSSAVRGRRGGRGKAGRGSRGRGRGRGRGTGSVNAPVDPTEELSPSHEADYRVHARQNGHAGVEVIEVLDGDEVDDSTGERLTRGKSRGRQTAQLDDGTWRAQTESYDAVYGPTASARGRRRSRKSTAEADETQLPETDTNGYLQPAPSLSPKQSDEPTQPPSPIIDLGDGADEDHAEETEAKLLSAFKGVQAELDATDQLDDVTARAAVVEVSDDDAEDEPLATKAAKYQAASRKTTKRKRTSYSAPHKRKAQTAAKKTTKKGNDRDEPTGAADENVTVSKQQEGNNTKRSAKGGKAAAKTAAAVNGHEDTSINSDSTSKPTKAKRSYRSKASSPSPDSPTAADAAPASVFSSDPHPSDYHLAAVLLHKGQYANHGHYTATLRDDKGVWWSFDDRVVTKLGERFYNKGGEVVIDAKEGKQDEDKEKEPEKKSSEGDGQDEVEVVCGDGTVVVEDKVTKAEEQHVEAEEVVEVEASAPSAKKRRGGGGGRTKAQAQQEMQMESGANVETADDQPAKRRSGRPKKAPESTAATTEAVAEDKPAKPAKKAGRPKKSAAQKVNADASGVDAKTKREAERMYGPGGYSKDAYMLLYVNEHHPALIKLKDEQDKADAELHNSEQPPTFLTVASHPQLAKLLIKKYHKEEVERENEMYQAECAAYTEKRAVIETEMERRKVEIEAVAAILQAQAIEVDKAAEEELDTSLEERAEVLEQGKRTRFVSTQWLAKFLTGWTEPEKEKKADAKAKKAAETNGKDEKAEGKGDNDAGQKNGHTSSVIDISSDDDSSADNNTATDKQQPKEEEAAADEQADAGENKEEKSDSDKQKDERDEKEEDPGAIVVDHDVHISADGMEQALKHAINQLDPGSLTDSVHSIRCPHHRDKLSPHMLTAVKRVTVEAWEALVRLDQVRSRKLLQDTVKRIEAVSVAGDVDMIPSSQADEMDADVPAVPSMRLSDVCLDCARSLFLGDLTRKRKVERVHELLDEYREYRQKHKNNATPPKGSLWISNAFIQRWKRYCQQMVASAKAAKDAAQQAELASKQKELDAVQLGDAMEGLKCEHNALSTDRTARLWLSRKLWQDITGMASVEDAEMYDVNAEECSVCKDEEEQDNEEAKQHKAAMKDERTALRAWASKSHRFPDPASSPALLFNKTTTIYLLPQSFQSDVYSFLHQRDPTEPPRPHFSVAPLLCEHQLLKYVPRPDEGVIGGGGLVGTRLGVLVYCDEKVWAELKRYQYVDEDEAGVQLQYEQIVAGDGVVSEQWSSYELRPSPAVCEECVRRRQADEETGRTVFTKEDGGGIRVTTVATEDEAKSTTSSSSSSFVSASAASSAASPPSINRPRRAAATRGTKQPLAVVELNCSSSDPVYQLKMELLSQSYSAAWEPARQQWYWQGRLMDDSRTLADYGVVRGGEVKVWLGGESEWDGSEAGHAEMWSEGKKGKGTAAAERGFQGTALAMHARQHVQNAAVSQPVQDQGATVSNVVADQTHDPSNEMVQQMTNGDTDDNNRSERPELTAFAERNTSMEAD